MTETLFDRAVMLHQAGNLAEARNSYEQILQKSPRDVNALNFQDACQFHGHRVDPKSGDQK